MLKGRERHSNHFLPEKTAAKIKTTLISKCLTRALLVPAQEQSDTRAFVPTAAANRATATLGE